MNTSNLCGFLGSAAGKIVDKDGVYREEKLGACLRGYLTASIGSNALAQAVLIEKK